MPVRPECPPHVDVETLAGLPSVLRLACFGDAPITLEGDVTCHDQGSPTPAAEPPWMTWDGCYVNPPGAPPYDPLDRGSRLGIPIHYPPDAERLTGELIITGHFDDPRASECQFFVPTEEGDAYGQDLYHREQQLGCRASFVVASAAGG